MSNEERPGFHHMFGAGIAAAITAADRSGLLTAVAERPGSAAELAEKLELDARATGLVLEVLGSMGVVECDEGIYRRGGDALSARDPWPGLAKFLRDGVTATYIDDPSQRGEMYATVVLGLWRRGRRLAMELAERLDPADRILDVGAGSAVWSTAMAERTDHTTVLALDRPEVVEVLAPLIEGFSLGDRVRAVAGDYYEPLPEGPFDRVVLASVLHLETEEDATALLARAADVTADDGEVVIVDMLGGDRPEEELGQVFYRLHLGMRTRKGGSHGLDALVRMCRAAGLPDVRVLRAPRAMGMGALVARRGPERLATDEAEEQAALRTSLRHTLEELATLRRRHAYLFDGTGDALMVVSHGVDMVVDVNRAFAELFGVDWWPLSRPHDHASLIAEEDREAFAALLRDLRAGNTTARRHRFTMQRADGTRFVAEVSSYDPGYRTAALFAIRDLTKEIEALVQKEKMTALGALVSGVAHDVNTPLGVVKSNMALIGEVRKRLDGAHGDRRVQLLRSIDDGTRAVTEALERLESMVASLADFADLEGSELRALQPNAPFGLTRAIAEKIASTDD